MPNDLSLYITEPFTADPCLLAAEGNLDPEHACWQAIYAIESGSTRTGAGYGVYDHCAEIMIWCATENVLISYAEERNKNMGALSDEFLLQTAATINGITTQLLSNYQTPKICTMFTAGLRMASNVDYAAKFLQNELVVPLNMVSQYQEGAIAYAGVALEFNGNLIVWDSGGLSVQFTWEDDNAALNVAGMQISATSFLYKMQSSIPGLSADAYPMSPNLLNQAFALAKNEVSKIGILPRELEVVGVGGHRYTALHYAIMFGGAAEDSYTRDQLVKAILKLSELSFAEVKQLTAGSASLSEANRELSARRDLAALILIYTTMLEYNFKIVRVGGGSNLHGLAALECEMPPHRE